MTKVSESEAQSTSIGIPAQKGFCIFVCLYLISLLYMLYKRAHVWRSEDNFMGLELSFHLYSGLWDELWFRDYQQELCSRATV